VFNALCVFFSKTWSSVAINLIGWIVVVLSRISQIIFIFRYCCVVKMKNEILDILQSKGNLKEKKLLKKILKQIGRKDDEEDEELLNQYKKTLEELVEEKDILLVNNEYCINKVKSSKAATKRLGTFDNLDEDEPLFKKSKATTEASHTVTKKFDYPDLWRNGEKFWKEGTFDPEYLRTNPDKYARFTSITSTSY
jgi:hypothetical protein